LEGILGQAFKGEGGGMLNSSTSRRQSLTLCWKCLNSTVLLFSQVMDEATTIYFHHLIIKSVIDFTDLSGCEHISLLSAEAKTAIAPNWQEIKCCGRP